MNMNDLFDRLTNFKIKHRENPTPTEVSNMNIVFESGFMFGNDIISLDITNNQLIIVIGNSEK